MRFSVTLGKDLMEEAKTAIGKKAKKEAIEEALKELATKKRREEAISHARKIEMDFSSVKPYKN